MSIVQRLCAALAVTGLLLSTLLVATPSVSAAGGSAAYDRSLNVSTCDLLGRVYVKGSGCARKKCVQGAKLWRKVYGAEACQLRNQGDFGFVATVDFRRCAALGRRWISQVNFCASYPDRSATAVYDAPQCAGARSVYVTNTEADGFYDECLTPDRVRELVGIARSSGSDLTAEASLRSSVQCDYRPGTTYVDGRCVSDPGSVPAKGGTLMVGDSLTWRGTDELARLQREAHDRRRARPADQRAAGTAGLLRLRVRPAHRTDRRARRRSRRPPATGSPTWPGRSRACRAPRRSCSSCRTPRCRAATPRRGPPRSAPGCASIAKARGRACVADWPSFVRSRHGLIQDGVHVKNSQERTWAKFISQQWGRC